MVKVGDQGTRAFIANPYGGSVTDEKVTKYTTDDPKFVKGLDKASKWIKRRFDDERLSIRCTGRSKTLRMVKLLTLFSTRSKGCPSLNYWCAVEVVAPLPSDSGKPKTIPVNGFAVFNKDEKKVAAAKNLFSSSQTTKNGVQKIVRTGAFQFVVWFGKLYGWQTDGNHQHMDKILLTILQHDWRFCRMWTFKWFPMLHWAKRGWKIWTSLKTFYWKRSKRNDQEK